MQPMPYPPGMPPPGGTFMNIPCLYHHLVSVSTAMYATPAMGQMHRMYSISFPMANLLKKLAPQAYMPPPPPPGAYPPPPNGAQPRPSMPPTPIPGHAHPYYHQSPQRETSLLNSKTPQLILSYFAPVQHAVPYPVMMPPPPSVPPHPYDGSAPPPVQMGGHA